MMIPAGEFPPPPMPTALDFLRQMHERHEDTISSRAVLNAFHGQRLAARQNGYVREWLSLPRT